MKQSLTYYNRLSILAFLVLLALVGIQVSWLWKATIFQQKEQHQKLQGLVSEVALEINGMGHDIFHGDSVTLERFVLGEAERRVDSILNAHGIEFKTYFAIYQDTTVGLFKTNQETYKEELMNSDIKSCLSCIVSFSVLRDSAKSEHESQEEFEKRLRKQSTFQYFSPVNKLSTPSGKTLWLSLYQPNAISNALWSLVYLFVISMLLLLCLLFLFYHVIRSLSKHKKMSQVKNDFFNNMTHEFKTPLSSIRLASKVLRESKNPEKNEGYHALIEKESMLLENQIDKLLELSLLESGGMALEKVTMDLHSVIAEIPSRLKILIEEKQAEVIMDLQMEDSFFNGDSYHLSNSLCNLVENSLKYSDAKVKIWISSFSKGDKKMVTVRDNGPGINPEFQNQIFDRFFRGQKNNQYKGSGFGIGLSYVKSIIEGHGGSIELNKTYEDGTEFLILL